MTDVVVRDVTMRYGEQVVLSHFSHRFSAGRAHCVMGSSGCGKTTLLRLIAGLETPESGEIEGVGKLGFLFQEDRLISHLTARKNVALVLTGRDTDARAGAALKALGLSDSMDKPARELSGGMARRSRLPAPCCLKASCSCWMSRFADWTSRRARRRRHGRPRIRRDAR